MATLADLQRRINEVRRKERKVILITGLSRLLVCFIGVLSAYLLLDWVLDLHYWARLVGAAGGLSVCGYVLNKHLLRQLRKLVDDDEIALRVESRNPDLRGRLISTLQLTRAGKAGQYVGSEEMLSALEDETLRMSAPLDFMRIINMDMLKKFGVGAAIVVLIKLVLCLEFPGYYRALAARLVNPEAQFPTKTRVLKCEVPEFVARGDELKITALVEGTIPEEAGSARLRGASGQDVSIELRPDAQPGSFSGTLNKALEDMLLRVYIGDGRSNDINIRVLPRPELDVEDVAKSSIILKLPAYALDDTKLKRLKAELLEAKKGSDPDAEEKVKKLEVSIGREEALRRTEPERFGGISVLTGATAEFRITATKPLAQAALKTSWDPNPAGVALEKVDDAGLQWRLPNFRVDRSGSFCISLLDQQGLRNSQPAIEYPIDARPDHPPSIKMLKPASELTAIPTAKVNLSFEARDDYAVRCVWLCYQIQQGTEAQDNTVGETKRIELGGVPHEDRVTGKGVWSLSEINAKPGNQVMFWLEADDDCPNKDRAPQMRRTADEIDAASKVDDRPKIYYSGSAKLKLTIVTREEKAAELQAKVQALYQQLQGDAANQQELERKVMQLLEAIEELKK